MKAILFISHDASRTGAPITFMRFIASFKKHGNYTVLILLRKGGPLERDFAKFGDVFIWNPDYSKNVLLKFLQRAWHQVKRRQFKNKIRKSEVILNNTVTNSLLLQSLPLKGKKVYSYFHELEVLTSQVPDSQIDFITSQSEKVFVGSNAVKRFFIERYHLNANKVLLLDYIIPEVLVVRPTSKEVKQFTVGFCGSLNWRKGYDLLPQLVREIVKIRNVSDIHFEWIGGSPGSLEYSVLIADLRKLGLENFLSIKEATDDLSSFFSSIDVFVLPSREDPFPLVVLEAAVYHLPCVCFEGAGGFTEFVEDDAGICVPYLDITVMGDAIIRLKNDSALRTSLGEKASEKVRRFMDDKRIIREFLTIIS